jgi:hypothetical protein
MIKTIPLCPTRESFGVVVYCSSSLVLLADQRWHLLQHDPMKALHGIAAGMAGSNLAVHGLKAQHSLENCKYTSSIDTSQQGWVLVHRVTPTSHLLLCLHIFNWNSLLLCSLHHLLLASVLVLSSSCFETFGSTLRAPLGRWPTTFSRHRGPTPGPVLARPRSQHALGGPKRTPCAANRHSTRISPSASPPRAL